MKNRITPQKITKLAKNEIFVFGSNSQGNHCSGAAKLALDKFGAIMGCGYGLQGKSYAINTMSGIDIIEQGIINLINDAKLNPKSIFLVTEIGCGIANYTREQIAPLFEAAKEIENIHLPQSFWDILNKPKSIKGYKVFDPNFKCRDYQFSENSEHKFKGKIQMCGAGFHFCLKLSDCFSYYKFDKNNIVCEVEAVGDFETHNEDSKICTNHLKIGKKLTWEEVLFNANEGVNNTGHSNSGDWNSGNRNSGDSNSGDWNSGNWNSGNRNSGDSNSGYRNSGAFCTDQNPVLFLFNKPSKMTIKEWENSPAINFMYSIEPTIWVPFNIMTNEEKEANPKAETTEGYLKTIPIKEAWKNAWNNWDAKTKKTFTSLENFDSVIFEEITGIKI